MRKISILLILTFFLLQAFADELVPIPELTYRVTDLTGTLNESQIISLEKVLENFQKEDGSEIVVVIIPTTGDETIEDYTIRLAEQWKVGRENIDDGIILLVAKDDRKVRIEVGYGLEAYITDAKANYIINSIIVPQFKNSYFYAGIDFAISEMINIIRAANLEEQQEQYIPKKNKGNKTLRVLSSFAGIYVIVTIVLLFILCNFLRKKIKKWSLLVQPVISFIIAFGICALFRIELGDLKALHIAGIFTGINFVVCVLLSPTKNTYRSNSSGGYTFSIKNYSSGKSKKSSYSSSSKKSYGGGGGSSSSSSRTKYKGGGGSFGGGGATGSW